MEECRMSPSYDQNGHTINDPLRLVFRQVNRRFAQGLIALVYGPSPLTIHNRSDQCMFE